MKIKSILASIFLLTAAAFGQAGRYDNFVWSLTGNNLYTPLGNASVLVYNYPGAGIACNGGGCSAAVTFSDPTEVTACGTTSPLTGSTSAVCVGATDIGGNFGFWVAPGKYQYCVSSSFFGTKCTNILVGVDPSVATTFTGNLTLNGNNTFGGTNAFNGAVTFGSTLIVTGLATFNGGAKSSFFQSSTANAASSGAVRLASADLINWRNNANGADVSLSKDTSDRLNFNAKILNDGLFPGTETIGTGTSTSNGTAISNGVSQAQPAITVTGATATDVAICALNAAPPATWQTGIVLLPAVVTSNTVTPWLSNPTAAPITPAATAIRCTVVR